MEKYCCWHRAVLVDVDGNLGRRIGGGPCSEMRLTEETCTTHRFDLSFECENVADKARAMKKGQQIRRKSSKADQTNPPVDTAALLVRRTRPPDKADRYTLNSKPFASDEFCRFLLSKGIACSRTTPYNLQGSAQTERYAGIILQIVLLSLKSDGLPTEQWPARLPAL
ncbi:hypothetical protein T02_3017 [Trichinella nativa]|uniref:Uncharacterized protein n=1 Tax=Trichinella nativa TaxID=6335 RepID=A0A0V1L5M8_9BILA|nr:hypothetical protein T02_3017 [Trichinella nativa]